MFGHSRDRLRNVAGGTAHAGVVEQNDLPSGGELIGHGRIPVVERSGEVLQEEQRQPGATAEPPVRVGVAIRL